MPEVSYQSFLSSKPFLVFGPGGRLFYVHGSLLAKSSPVLRRDVEGEMREQQLQTINIKDVDGDIDDDTVMRFIEYAYTDEYTTPDPDVVQLPTDPEELQEAFEAKLSPLPDVWTGSKKSKKGKKKRLSTWTSGDTGTTEVEILDEADVPEEVLEAPEEPPVEEAEARNIRVGGPVLQKVDIDRQWLWRRFSEHVHTIQRPTWQPQDNNDERDDYTGVFLCHARLYKFSDRYSCSKLGELALQKL